MLLEDDGDGMLTRRGLGPIEGLDVDLLEHVVVHHVLVVHRDSQPGLGWVEGGVHGLDAGHAAAVRDAHHGA